MCYILMVNGKEREIGGIENLRKVLSYYGKKYVAENQNLTGNDQMIKYSIFGDRVGVLTRPLMLLETDGKKKRVVNMLQFPDDMYNGATDDFNGVLKFKMLPDFPERLLNNEAPATTQSRPYKRPIGWHSKAFTRNNMIANDTASWTDEESGITYTAKSRKRRDFFPGKKENAFSDKARNLEKMKSHSRKDNLKKRLKDLTEIEELDIISTIEEDGALVF